ncbi:hypothetical protein BJY59DRAFT_757565 [Rhodotorula toruloides]
MAPSRSSSAKKGKGKASALDENGRPPKIKRVKEVVFDADSRKEYLTGFSKRKKAKQTARRNKAIEREKEALRDMRRQASLHLFLTGCRSGSQRVGREWQRSGVDPRSDGSAGLSSTIREERKERAAHNVKVAREMYGGKSSFALPSFLLSQLTLFLSPTDADGDAEEEDDDAGTGSEGSSDEEGSDEEGPAAAYETPDAMTTVVVESLSLSRSPTPEPLPPAPSASSASTSAGQQSSLYKKRVKNAVQARPKLTRQEKKDRATGGKKTKKKMASKMKGTKGRANK